jgi:uncharacterized membrane protein YfcA
VIVPLLLLVPDVSERRATAASLLAIAVMAASGASIRAAHGHVHVGGGLLAGAPAVLGVLFGMDVQPRLSARAISLSFAGLLAVVGVLTAGDVNAHQRREVADKVDDMLTTASWVVLIGTQRRRNSRHVAFS